MTAPCVDTTNGHTQFQFQLSRLNTHQLMRHHDNATPPEQLITLVEVFHQQGLISDEK
jgi:hypothetical protein